MASSLRDIPGAAPSRRHHGGARRARGAASAHRPPVLFDPSAGMRVPGRLPGRRKQLFGRRRRPDLFIVALVVGSLGLAGYLYLAAHDANAVVAGISGVEDGAILTAEAAADLEVVLRVETEDQLELAVVSLDGVPLEDVEVDDLAFWWRPDPEEPLRDGTHVFELTVPRALNGTKVTRRTFTVDGTAPRLTVPALLPAGPIDAPVTVTGEVEPGTTLTLAGEEVPTADGRFDVEFAHPPAGPLRFEATDAAGNTSRADAVVPVAYPGCRGIHVSAAAWDNDELRQGVLDLIEADKVDCVELDLKDEGGIIGHRTSVPLAVEIGASQSMYDLEDAVEDLHDRGVRVVGRLVAFRDPVLAQAAWARGDEDWVIQTRDGEPLPNYGGFTNFANPDVRAYNLAIAVEAADAGVDEVLWDYIRRPEGALDEMVFPGLEGDVKASIVDFLAEVHPELRSRGVLQGVSVFGIAASRPDPVGQDVPAIARNADYISPMVYPSLWVSGEYGVDDPKSMPYEIVTESLKDFQVSVAGTGATLVPWLQHFDLGHVYGPAEIRAQRQAASDLGIDSFLLWSPRVRYHSEGLDAVPAEG